MDRGFMICDGTGGFVEYAMRVNDTQASYFKLRIKLNAKQSRPLLLKVNDTVVSDQFARATTGEWWKESKMRWFEYGPFKLPGAISNLGPNVYRVRLEAKGYFPHISALSFATCDHAPTKSPTLAEREKKERQKLRQLGCHR